MSGKYHLSLREQEQFTGVGNEIPVSQNECAPVHTVLDIEVTTYDNMKTINEHIEEMEKGQQPASRAPQNSYSALVTIISMKRYSEHLKFPDEVHDAIPVTGSMTY